MAGGREDQFEVHGSVAADSSVHRARGFCPRPCALQDSGELAGSASGLFPAQPVAGEELEILIEGCQGGPARDGERREVRIVDRVAQ